MVAELIVALDHRDAPTAVAFLDQLPPSVPVKVGSKLFTRAGSGFVRALVASDHPVFLDLKWHDIPNTVAGAVEAAVDLGVTMLTLHALGGEEMLHAAVAAAKGRVKLVAVTVLTSHTAESWASVTGRSGVALGDEVQRLAEIAIRAGVDGVVCSAEEVVRVKSIVAQGLVVVPGIRRAEDVVDDQQRIATPERAVAAGATHLVVGRPLLDAVDPAAAYEAFRLAAVR